MYALPQVSAAHTCDTRGTDRAGQDSSPTCAGNPAGSAARRRHDTTGVTGQEAQARGAEQPGRPPEEPAQLGLRTDTETKARGSGESRPSLLARRGSRAWGGSKGHREAPGGTGRYQGWGGSRGTGRHQGTRGGSRAGQACGPRAATCHHPEAPQALTSPDQPRAPAVLPLMKFRFRAGAPQPGPADPPCLCCLILE